MGELTMALIPDSKFGGLEMARLLDPIRGLEGHAVMPDDPGYEPARRVFNGMIDRRPALIVRPAGTDDVARAITYARDRDLRLAVRGGGHNVAGNAVVDGGVVIDHSVLREVRVDAASEVADAQPGATWYDFDQASQGYGLATTGGLISSTGVAGFTLGGGIGWLVRRHGLACDNLVEADLVTADGGLARAGEGSDPDLLWALRGGGGNFGVVTRFRFRLHPCGPVTGGLLGHPRPAAGEVLRFWRDFIRSAPRELTTIAALMTTPEGHPAVGIALCHAGPPEQAGRDIRPLREFGPPLMDQVGVMPYTVLQSALDPTAPIGMRNYWKSDFLDELTDDAIDAVIEGANASQSPLSQIHIHHLGGAMAEEPAGGAAFAGRRAGFVYNIIGMWPDAGLDQANIDWTRSVFDALKPFSRGAAYINFLGDDGQDRIRAAYGASYARLSTIKRRLDPDNVFRMNQNILPG
jgi:FAD/FMN-containing dehydrogenase